MPIPLTLDDQSVVRTALDLLDKAVDAARKAVERISLPTAPVEVIGARAEELRGALNRATGDEEWDIPAHLAPTLRVGLALLVEKLEKVEESQENLGILDPEDTTGRLEAAKDLAGRLHDQLSLV